MSIAPAAKPKTDAAIRAELDARWQARMDKDPPPDLQALAQAHGGYSLVPGAAWAEFDNKVKAWKARRDAPGRWM